MIVCLVSSLLLLSGVPKTQARFSFSKYFRVSPAQNRDSLLVLDPSHLYKISLGGEKTTTVTYAHPLNLYPMHQLLSGKHKVVVLDGNGKVLDVTNRAVKGYGNQGVSTIADSTISLFGNDLLATVRNEGHVSVGNKVIRPFKDGAGVYSAVGNSLIYISSVNHLYVYDTSRGSFLRSLPLKDVSNISIDEWGNVAVPNNLSNLTVYTQGLKKVLFKLTFGKNSTIWSTNMYDGRLIVVIWGGQQSSMATWTAHYYNLKTGKEVSSYSYNHSISCFGLKNNKMAVVDESGISLDKFGVRP